MTFTAKGECGENHTFAQRLNCVKCKEIARKDRPTLIYYIQTVLNTFKREEEDGYHSRDRQYAIELLEKAMEYQNDIWNAAIEAAANKVESAGNILLAHSVRKLKK